MALPLATFFRDAAGFLSKSLDRVVRSQVLSIVAAICAICCGIGVLTAPVRADDRATVDPLPAWNEGPTKRALIAFVSKVTAEGGTHFVSPLDRIATFDNDGTLWAEQPNYFQAFFIFDRIRSLAPQHPEWKTREPFASALKGDYARAMTGGEKALDTLLMSTHAGMTTDEFQQDVLNWIHTARHPRFRQPFNKCIYQPMLELMAYLRRNGFKTYMVTGGGIDFVRPWAWQTYGVPPEQVVGSSIQVKYELRAGKPTLLRVPQIDFVDDGPGKAGRHPQVHRQAADRGVRQLGRGSPDAGMGRPQEAGRGSA
jgi:hypothetical protein